MPYILKASYKKANRTSASSFTGIGDKVALEIIKNAGEKFSIPTTTDIHTAEEAGMVQLNVADVAVTFVTFNFVAATHWSSVIKSNGADQSELSVPPPQIDLTWAW